MTDIGPGGKPLLSVSPLTPKGTVLHHRQNQESTMKAVAKKQLRRGQGMTEYIIIVALIAIAAVGIITLFGNNIRKLFGASANVLAGNDAKNDGSKSKAALTKKTMQNFGENNVSAY
jgi:Flp pilus assembly pilin Flp